MKNELRGNDSEARKVVKTTTYDILNNNKSVTKSELKRLLLDVHNCAYFAVMEIIHDGLKRDRNVEFKPITKVVDYEIIYH